ncbi:MAG TPA: efflux RND transporter periplasmic adaptor subunit [Candidatus Krumholzibacteria bacterium]|nr:efflux RND transporter periplasmic adaptor subunit [Candidatus Krumholzibacteria bacterium]HPD70361.1 efflux RND transporter periplasmic adaptor subunit [Candidatus Krumholzibacteria bacterium]HRY39939.1 efflux RND transporter periplasmic adaptor subunit [Candidatus Krumholzibacteria bacterium]
MTLPLRTAPFALAVLALAAPGTAAPREGRSSAPVPVLAAQVTARPMPLVIAAVGTVEPIESVAVRAQVTGVITEVAFREGEEVQKGQRLFQIDPRPLEAALAGAEAQLAQDRAEADNARVQAERYDRLVERDFVTKEQAEEARTRVAALDAAVRADEAAVEQARLNLAYASVKAPIAGRTGAVLVRQGNLARAADAPLVVINQLRPIRVRFAIPGDRLGEVLDHRAAGDLQVTVRPSRDDGEPPLEGRVVFVDNAVDAGTGTIMLKAEFANDRERLWPGQFVAAELALTVEPTALTVPAGAVVTSQEGPFVFVIGGDGKVEKRVVQVSRTVNGTTVLAGGVAAGETVVTDGQLRLVPGATVEIKAGLAR